MLNNHEAAAHCVVLLEISDMATVFLSAHVNMDSTYGGRDSEPKAEGCRGMLKNRESEM